MKRWQLALLLIINNLVVLGLCVVIVYLFISSLDREINLGDFVVSGTTITSPRVDSQMQMRSSAAVVLQSASGSDLALSAPGAAVYCRPSCTLSNTVCVQAADAWWSTTCCWTGRRWRQRRAP
jgi:hypothetical protein